MRRQQQPFGDFACKQSSQALDTLRGKTIEDDQWQQDFQAASEQSLEDQRKAEAADTQSFDDFLTAWNDYRLD